MVDDCFLWGSSSLLSARIWRGAGQGGRQRGQGERDWRNSRDEGCDFVFPPTTRALAIQLHIMHSLPTLDQGLILTPKPYAQNSKPTQEAQPLTSNPLA